MADPKARLAELQQLKSSRGLTIAEWYEVSAILKVLGAVDQAAEAERRAGALLAKQIPPEQPAAPAQATSYQPRGTGLNREILPPGCVSMLLGAALAFYFVLVFDTSVEVPRSNYFGYSYGGGRVNNIGLMQDQMIGIVVGLALLFGGFLMRLLRGSRAADRSR